MERELEYKKPDIMVNFAAEFYVDRSIENPGVFFETNIIGTQVMMDACRMFGNIRFHLVSTDDVIHKGLIGEVYNVVGHNEMTNIDIMKLIH